MGRYLLASASPRRRELLETAGYLIEVVPSNIEETITSSIPEEVVKDLALQKAMNIANCKAREEDIVIGADTIVVLNNKILGKPVSKEDAHQILLSLQGKKHLVYTGVALIYLHEAKKEIINFTSSTEVEMYAMTETEIDDYINTGEPMDKAGAYAIQGMAMKFVKEIKGDYHSVVGLPVARIYQEIKRKWGK